MRNGAVKGLKPPSAVLFALLAVASSPFALAGASAYAAEQPASLQRIVDAAAPGDVVTLAAGEYEGPVVIGKTLTIRGQDGARVSVTGGGADDAVIDIRAANVALQGLDIRQNRRGEATAVAVGAEGAKLEELNIETGGYGIRLREADDATIRANRIVRIGTGTASGSGSGEAGAARTSNGIDLFGSHGATIEGNEIDGMKDGVYLENSHRAVVRDNRVYRSRYGIHCMYTNETRIVGNVGEGNVTGAMVMGVSDALVQDNSFRKQSENVHSQGLLLFDVRTSRIEGNVVEGNRVGLYMEQSADNELTGNRLIRNFIGIQFLESSDNSFEGNSFVSNVIEAEATDSEGNRMDGNYWDAVQGLDANGDGRSDLAYAINPFYPRLVDKTPAFQLFFQSPGMTFLSERMTGEKDDWAKDVSPLMAAPEGTDEGANANGPGGSRAKVGALGAALLGLSGFILFKGAKRR